MDPQLVVRRETGYFQTCFPVSRSVSRSVNRTVFPSKVWVDFKSRYVKDLFIVVYY